MVHEKGLQEKVFARIITFGKALGTHGSAVLGSKHLRDYLINFARSFIYTTAASPHTHLSIKTAYDFLKSGGRQTLIRDKISLFNKNLIGERLTKSRSPIQCYPVAGNSQARNSAAKLQEEGFDVRPILHPTVPIGKERLRICLHTFNSDEEITNLTKSLSNL